MPEAVQRRRGDHRLLIGCSLAVWVMVIGLGWLGYKYAGPRMSRGLRPPEALATPGVFEGAGLLSKTQAFREVRLGRVTAIVALQAEPDPRRALIIAGTGGAVYLDARWAVTRTVAFGRCATHVDVIAAERGRPPRFLNRGSWGCDAALMDQDGRVLWTYGGRGFAGGVNDTAAGDLDGDGALGFVVGFNGAGGVHRLDASGQKLWSQADGNVWHVELVDADGSGRRQIVHSNAGGQMTIRDGAGQVVRRTRLPVYFSHFSLARWPGKDDRIRALEISDGALWLFDFTGAVSARLDAPRASPTLRPRGTPVRLGPGQPEHFAVAAEWGAWHRSGLWVYGSGGALLYAEVLPEACAAVVAMPDPESGADHLLLGCEGKIWRYALAK